MLHSGAVLMLSPDMLSKCSLMWYGLKVKKRNLDAFWAPNREARGEALTGVAVEGVEDGGEAFPA